MKMLRKIKNLIKRKTPMNSNTYIENQSSSLENQFDSNNPVLKPSEDVINQIKDFPEPNYIYSSNYPFYDHLTQEQIDKLISNEELRERYKKYGLCQECIHPNTGWKWCQSCNSKHFQQDFNKWTSGNKGIDEFIQKFQLNATRYEEVLEWISYEKFSDVEYLEKGGFGTVHKAKWIHGYIWYWAINQTKWYRVGAGSKDVVLKCLNNSQNLTTYFLQEVCNLYLLLILYFILLILHLLILIYFQLDHFS